MPHPLISQDQIDAYQRDGVVLIKGLFADHVEALRAGIARNMEQPGPYAAENLKEGEAGRFFDDYCNWQRIPEFAELIEASPVAEAAADLMQSQGVQVFHDHVLVKEPGTSKPTPWHQDGPYYFVEGRQTVSFWSPLDPVEEASLRCVAGASPGRAVAASTTLTCGRAPSPVSRWCMASASSTPATPPPITATSGAARPSVTSAQNRSHRVAKGPSGLAATPCAAKPGSAGMSEVMPMSIEATS